MLLTCSRNEAAAVAHQPAPRCTTHCSSQRAMAGAARCRRQQAPSEPLGEMLRGSCRRGCSCRCRHGGGTLQCARRRRMPAEEADQCWWLSTSCRASGLFSRQFRYPPLHRSHAPPPLHGVGRDVRLALRAAPPRAPRLLCLEACVFFCCRRRLASFGPSTQPCPRPDAHPPAVSPPAPAAFGLKRIHSLGFDAHRVLDSHAPRFHRLSLQFPSPHRTQHVLQEEQALILPTLRFVVDVPERHAALRLCRCHSGALRLLATPTPLNGHAPQSLPLLLLARFARIKSSLSARISLAVPYCCQNVGSATPYSVSIGGAVNLLCRILPISHAAVRGRLPQSCPRRIDVSTVPGVSPPAGRGWKAHPDHYPPLSRCRAYTMRTFIQTAHERIIV